MPTNLYGPNDNFDLETSHALPALIRKFHEAKVRHVKSEELGVRGNVSPLTPNSSHSSPHPSPPGRLGSPAGNRPHPELCEGVSPHNDEVIIWGTGTPRREFLHVDDMADAVVFLLGMDEYHELTNIGTGTDIEIRELAAMIGEIVGFRGEIKFDSSKPDGTPQKLLDVSRINALGWKAGIGLKEGIAATYRWYLENQANITK
ncbi:MAG: NAD-dependent epimerase/dehydratase family protein, partial [bacterium]